MPTVQPSGAARQRAYTRSLQGSARFLFVGLAFASISLLVGCAALRSRGPVVESAPSASDSTPAPSEPSPPSAVEAAGGPTQDGRPLAARVNGQPIYLEVYEKQVAQTEQALIDQGLILEGDEGQAQLAQIRQNVLNGLIEQAVIEQAATATGVSVTDEELESTVQESIATGQGQESFDQWLAENGLTLDEFRAIQRSQLLASKMIEYVTGPVPTSAEQVHVRHILTSDPARAQALIEELRGGANFASLAQQASEDASTAANGGDLGWFPRDVPLMPSVVVDAAFALQPGETSGVIESNQGFHIIKVEAREENRPLTPEMVLYVRQRAFEQWLNEQLKNAVIEQYVDM
jgi:parvulin-like peptidyl-prolyl isomerase